MTSTLYRSPIMMAPQFRQGRQTEDPIVADMVMAIIGRLRFLKKARINFPIILATHRFCDGDAKVTQDICHSQIHSLCGQRLSLETNAIGSHILFADNIVWIGPTGVPGMWDHWACGLARYQ